MPDLDIVERNLKPHWRKVYRHIKNRQSMDLVGDELNRACAEQLRQEGGNPGFRRAIDLAVTGYRDGARSLSEKCRQYERDFMMSPGARGLADSVLRLAQEESRGRAISGPLSLAKQRCIQIADRCFFGRLQKYIGRGGVFESFEQLEGFRRELLRSADSQLWELANRLTRNPSASGLRAPGARTRRATTREFLDQPFLKLEAGASND